MKITDGQHRTAPTSPVSPTSRTTERDAANASVEDGSPVRVTLSVLILLNRKPKNWVAWSWPKRLKMSQSPSTSE